MYQTWFRWLISILFRRYGFMCEVFHGLFRYLRWHTGMMPIRRIIRRSLLSSTVYPSFNKKSVSPTTPLAGAPYAPDYSSSSSAGYLRLLLWGYSRCPSCSGPRLYILFRLRSCPGGSNFCVYFYPPMFRIPALQNPATPDHWYCDSVCPSPLQWLHHQFCGSRRPLPNFLIRFFSNGNHNRWNFVFRCGFIKSLVRFDRFQSDLCFEFVLLSALYYGAKIGDLPYVSVRECESSILGLRN